jgi:3-isopropylmalate dehydrogenase
VDARHLYIDTLVMELVRAPQDFDVIVTNNLFGDIVSDLGAELQGGIGLAASANLNLGGEDGAVFGGRRHGLFEPVHGSAPTLAGRGVANPMAAVRSVGMMLDFLGWPAHAVAIEQAVRGALLADEVTQELGGALTTAEVTAALIARLGPGTPA